MPNLPTKAASDGCWLAHERAATMQAARKAAAHGGFDEMAPAAPLLALRICTSYSTRLAPCIRRHLVRNAAHEGFCISLLGHTGRRAEITPVLTPAQLRPPISRACSILTQRFITTSSPASLASLAASSLRIPSCIHNTFADRKSVV